MKAAWVLPLLLAIAQSPAPRRALPAMRNWQQHVASAAATATASHGAKPAKRTRAAARRKQEAAPALVRSFLRMPLDFEINQGQAPAEYAFVAHGPSYALGISSTGIALSLHNLKTSESERKPGRANALSLEPHESANLELRLLGGTASALSGSGVTGLDPQPGRSSYFIGGDPTHWRTRVPHYNRVRIASAFPGVDLVLYGSREQLEYDFAVAPGADPGLIRLQLNGTDSVTLDKGGNAILGTAAGDVELESPVAYQEIGGVRRPVESRFELADGNVLRFGLGKYDRERPLVIDPVLIYSEAFGGSNGNQGVGMTVDAAGNAYVTGNTCSTDFPSTAGNFTSIHTNPAAKACQDAFLVKLDPSASTLIFSDFIGGSGGSSTGTHVAVDSSQNVYMAGATGASSFPTVSSIGPTAPAPCGLSSAGFNCPDGFILKLSPDGSQLLWSSLLGGNQASGAFQVKLNPVTGDLVVLGETNSSSFQPAPTTLETSFGGGTCANSTPCFNSFLLGLNPATGALRYGTYIGGAGNDWSAGLAFDKSGNIYVAGSAQPPLSSALGTVTHTYGPAGGATAAGAGAFVAKLNLSGTTLTPGYLTLVEGDANTGPSSLAVDSSGNAYFGGDTAAQHLAVTAGAYQSTNKDSGKSSCLWGVDVAAFLPNACGTGMVGKLDATGALSFLTYLGGSGQDEVEGLGLDSGNNLWLTGITSSPDFPLTADQYPNPTGYSAPCLAEMSNDGTRLLFGTLTGGTFGQSTDLIIDAGNNIYITGFSTSVAFTPGVYPSDPATFTPVFVEKWGEGAAPSISISPTTLDFGQIGHGASSAPQTVTVQNTGTGPMELGVQFEPEFQGGPLSDFPESTNCGASLAAGASCTITVWFEPGPVSPLCTLAAGCTPTQRIANILVANNAIQGTKTISLHGTAAVGPSVTVTPNPIVFPAQASGTSSTALYTSAGNSGDALLTIGNMVLSGPNASDFQLTLTGVGGFNCLNNPISPGTYCSFEIAFSPPANATGARSATLTFTDTAGDSPQSIPVTGTIATANFLNISPLNLSPTFPVAIGTTTYSVLDLQNPSTTDSVQVTGLNTTGANMGDFSTAPANCGTNGALPMTIPANSTCYVDVTFNPAAGASGTRTATLTVQTTPAATGLPTVSLTGDAVTNSQPGMSLSVIPDPLNFGGLQVGEASNPASVLFTIYNRYPIPCASGASTCGAPLTINSITAGLSDYSVSAALGSVGCTPFPATISIGGNCTYGVVFDPAQAGPRNTTLTIQSNDPQGIVQVPVFGTGLSIPLGEMLGSALDFGKSAIGVASPPLTTTLQNAGQSNLAITSVSVSTNFAISANNCNGSIPPQGLCNISVTFTPPTAGYFTGTLTISDNDPFGAQQIVTLAGTGATGAQVRIAPGIINFGNQPVNSISSPLTITLTSTGDTTVAFPANALLASPDFVVQATTCGSTLTFGTSCTASVQYKPTKLIGIPEDGTLLITDNATGNPQAVYLEGTATQSSAAASTTSLISSLNPSTSGQTVMFTAIVTGPSGSTTVPTGTVTFLDGSTSLGTGMLNASGQATLTTLALGVGSHSITASYGGDTNFTGSASSVLTQVVNAVVRAGSTTSLTSSANPAQSGQPLTFTATVSGPSGNPTVPTGSVNFLDGASTLGNVTLNSAGFATFSTSLLSAGSHSITAVYGGDSNFTGSTSTALTQSVGTPSFTIGFNPTTVTVTAGLTGTTTVSVTPAFGFSQQVSFACSGLPAASTCAFSPATVILSGTGPASTTLTVATNVATASLTRPAPLNWRSPVSSQELLAVILLGLGGLVRFRRNWRGRMLSLAVIAALCMVMAGCGGKSNSGGSGGATTPKGTTTVTATATSGNLSQTATFTLIVQ